MHQQLIWVIFRPEKVVVDVYPVCLLEMELAHSEDLTNGSP